MAYLATDNKTDLKNPAISLPEDNGGEFHILPIEELDLEYTKDCHPQHGYNPMIDICNLSCHTDKHHMSRLHSISLEQAEISRDLDTLLLALDKVYVQLKDPTSTENLDLSDMLEEDMERIERIFNKLRSIDPELSISASPFADVDLKNLTRKQIETQILPQLESAKRNKQNAIPDLMTKLQEAVQLFSTINLMFQGMMESEKGLRKHISQRMAN